MTTIRQAYERIKIFQQSISIIIHDVVFIHADILVKLNRNQLLHGLDINGNILGPNYLQDPHFKTRAQAESYLRMKRKLEPEHNALMFLPNLFPMKNSTTPNLIITGSLQDSMFINISEKEYTIGSNWENAGRVNTKYKNLIFGLNPVSKQWFYRNYIKPALLIEFKRIMYGM